MKSPEEKARQIFGERAAFYTTSATHSDPHVLAKVVALSHPQPAWAGLDIATGSGHTACAVSPHIGSVVGIDITLQMLHEAEKLKTQRGLANVVLLAADVHNLPFADDAFQLVTCRRAAHHFSKITVALAEIRRVLSPGGRIVVDDRSVPEDDFLDQCMNQLDTWHDESHIREYRPEEWRRMLDDAGFIVESVEPYVQHRPISSLTAGVSEENVRKIHDTLSGLDARQREAFNLVEKDGTLYLNHWYVLLAASKA